MTIVYNRDRIGISNKKGVSIMTNQVTKTISSDSVQDIIKTYEFTGHSVYVSHFHDSMEKTYTFVNNDTDTIVLSINQLDDSPIAHLTELNISKTISSAVLSTR